MQIRQKRLTKNGKITNYFNQLGYTSLQLVLVIMIIGIISGFAAPVYAKVITDQYKITAMNAFQHSILNAKFEANKTLQHVVLCPSQDGVACQKDSRDYSYGWITFINRDKDYPIVRDSDEELLDSIRLKRNHFELLSNRKAYTFRATPKRSTNGTLMFCPNENIKNHYTYQAVIVSYIARPRIENSPKSEHIKICK